MSISFLKSDDGITVTLGDGFQGTLYSDSPKYSHLIDAIRVNNEERVRELCSPKVAVQAEVARVAETGLDVEVKNGTVYYKGTAVHTMLGDRIVELVSDGLPVTPMMWFLQNLMENPSYRAVQELYGFLEAGGMPITEDGCFLAYKRVRGDFMDSYTGTFDNSVGSICVMPRNEVNEDKSVSCSTGLHFCSRGYLGDYGAGHAKRDIMVKINPKNVVSIPEDYQLTKGRCCEYEVVAEINFRETHIEGAYRPDETIIADDVSGRAAEHMSAGAVVQLDAAGNIILVHESAGIAQSVSGVDSSSIRKVCRGQRNRAGGYGWKWVADVPGAANILAQEQAGVDATDDGYFNTAMRNPPHGAPGFGADPEDSDEFDDDRWDDDIPY